MLHTSSAAGRVYAKALFELAREQDKLSAIWEELDELHGFYHEDREFREFFTSPKVDREVKTKAVQEAFGNQLSKEVVHLLCVLVRKGRTALLDNVIEAYHSMKDAVEHRVHVSVRTARPLDDAQKEAVLARCKAASGRDDARFELHEIVDESLVGGMIVRVSDFMIDNSVRARLRAIRDKLRIEHQ